MSTHPAKVTPDAPATTSSTGQPDALRHLLRTAESELEDLRGRLRMVAEFIHDPALDLAARHALAQRLRLPIPTDSRPAAPHRESVNGIDCTRRPASH